MAAICEAALEALPGKEKSQPFGPHCAVVCETALEPLPPRIPPPEVAPGDQENSTS